MRVALDAQLAVGTATGIGEYASGLAAALERAGVDVVRLERTALNPWRFDRRVLWDQVLLPLAARDARADLVHCTSGTMPLLRPGPIVVTVHDVAWLRVQQHTAAYAQTYFGRLALRQYPHARRVLADSVFTARELAALAPIDPARIDVVYPGVAEDVVGVARRPDPAQFVLVSGTVEPRKNLATLVHALADVPGLRLVATGPSTPYRSECERLARELGIAQRIDFRGYVPRNELLELYARATVVAVPSTYEGFGYAAAWALCAGVPLLAADATSLPEIAGEAATLLPPTEPRAWATALRNVLEHNDSAEARARAARDAASLRFSWQSAAKAAIESYHHALTQHPS